MRNPQGLAVDAGHTLFVANGNSVLEFGQYAGMNSAPIGSISGQATGLNQPYGIAVRGTFAKTHHGGH